VTYKPFGPVSLSFVTASYEATEIPTGSEMGNPQCDSANSRRASDWALRDSNRPKVMDGFLTNLAQLHLGKGLL